MESWRALTQNDYKTMNKKRTKKKKTNLCLKVFKLQDKKFKIVQKNFQEIIIKISWKTIVHNDHYMKNMGCQRPKVGRN